MRTAGKANENTFIHVRMWDAFSPKENDFLVKHTSIVIFCRKFLRIEIAIQPNTRMSFKLVLMKCYRIRLNSLENPCVFVNSKT